METFRINKYWLLLKHGDSTHNKQFMQQQENIKDFFLFINVDILKLYK